MYLKNEKDLIFDEIRAELKKKKITYIDIAEALDLSEVTIKRIFSSRECSIERIIQICDAIDISFIDLVSLIKKSAQKNYTLTNEQERYFLKDIELMIFYFELEQAPIKTVRHICTSLNLSESFVIKSVNKLEKIKLAELHLNNKIKLLNKGSLNLPQYSELSQKIYNAHIKHISNIDLEDPNSILTLGIYSATNRGINEIVNELRKVILKCQQICVEDQKRYSSKDLRTVHWLIGFDKIFNDSNFNDKVNFYR